MATLKYNTTLGTHFQETTVASTYTASATSLVVTDGSVFPAAGDFWVAVGNTDPPDFLLKVTARGTGTDTNTLTVAATGADGTTLANVAATTKVRWVLGPAALDQLRSDQFQVGAYASLPVATSGKAGDHYLTTDSVFEFENSGSAWQAYGPCRLLTVPDNGTWTVLGTPTGTVVSSLGGINIVGANNQAGDRQVAISVTEPWRVEWGFLGSPQDENYCSINCGIRESTGDLRIAYGVGVGNLQVSYLGSGGSWGGWYYQSAGYSTFQNLGQPTFLAIHNDATNRIYEVSYDFGITWITVFSHAKNTHFTTPTHAFFGAGGSANKQPSGWLIHFKVTNL